MSGRMNALDIQANTSTTPAKRKEPSQPTISLGNPEAERQGEGTSGEEHRCPTSTKPRATHCARRVHCAESKRRGASRRSSDENQLSPLSQPDERERRHPEEREKGQGQLYS
ncbi:hypothetical protein MRX96_054682 [Rhipicephalus microplus]